MVASYWEMAASFVAKGIVHEELFFENNGELILVWEKIKHLVPEYRKMRSNPLLYGNLEKVATRHVQWMNSNAPGSYEAFAALFAPKKQQVTSRLPHSIRAGCLQQNRQVTAIPRVYRPAPWRRGKCSSACAKLPFMDLMQLEMFVAAAEAHGVKRAAERVFRTQPAVSMALRKLESELGASLFDRSNRGAYVLKIGRAHV